MELDKWQREALEADGNLLLCTGRQVGKTTIFARKAAEYMVKNKNSQIIAVSLTEDQAFLMKIMVQDYLEKNFKAYMKVPKKDKPTKNRITLNNKSSYVVRPVGNSGDAVRGFTGDVLIIDEAAKMPEQMWASAKPTLASTGGQIWMCSTPFGKQGYFYECYQNKHRRYRVIETNTLRVYKERPISEDWTEERKKAALEFLEQEKKDMSSLQYGQEYLGLFLEDLQQYFPDKLINSCCILKRPDRMPQKNNYLGVDIARMGGDECAYQIVHNATDIIGTTKLKHIYSDTRKEQLTTQTEKDILHLNKTINLEKIGIDAGAGSLGVGIYDRFLELPETKRKVIPMNNRQISLDREGKRKQRIFKEDMYDLLLSLMEKGEIALLDDEKVRASLKSVQWELVEFKGVSKVRIFGGYTHIVEGLVRAVWLAKKEKSKNFFISYI